MSPPALRTRLLNVFAHLAAADVSFAEGDLVIDDPDSEIFNDLYAHGMSVTKGWCELTLPTPLSLLCPCLACSVRADSKSALRFRKHGDYVLLRLLKDPWYTLDGAMELGRLALWGDPKTGEGCTGGWRSVDEPTYTRETLQRDEALHAKHKTLESLRLYNRKFRVGNELYAPFPLWIKDAVKTMK